MTRYGLKREPAVSIASSEFVTAATAQADTLGMPDAQRGVAHPIQDATDDEMRAKANDIVNEVVSALTA